MTNIIPDFLNNAFVTHFFTFDSILGEFVPEEMRRRVFEEYASVFCIDGRDELEKLYSALSSPTLTGANTTDTYNMLSRVVEFFPDSFSDSEKKLIRQKGAAIRIKKQLFGSEPLSTLEAALKELENSADGNFTHAASLMSFIGINGILVPPSPDSAEVRIEKFVRWNDLFCLLMNLKYGSDRKRGDTLARLRSILDTPLCREALERIEAHYPDNGKAERDDIAAALETSFNRGYLKRESADEKTLRMLSSPIISHASKLHLLSSKSREGIVEELPINIGLSTPIHGTRSLGRELAISRKDETNRMLANFAALDIMDKTSYKPLLIVCGDEAVLEDCKRRISAAFADRAAVSVDCACTPRFFSDISKRNPVVKALDSVGDAGCTVFIENCDELSATDAAELSKLVKQDARSRLTDDSGMLSLDLSDMLPVLFARRMPAGRLCEVCDTILPMPLSRAESRAMLHDMVDAKKRALGLDFLELDSSAVSYLEGMPLDEISRLIDKTVALSYPLAKKVTLNADSFAFASHKGFKATDFWKGASND